MVTVNLIPESIRSAQARRRHVKCWAVCLALTYAVAVIPAVAHWRQHMRVDNLHTQNDQIQNDVAAARVDLKTTTATANEIFLRIERAKALRSKRAWSSMLALIGDCLPKDCWLTALATDPDTPSTGTVGPVSRNTPPSLPSGGPNGPIGPMFIEAPRKLRMSGSAVDASLPLIFVARLKDSRVFREVTLERCLSDTPAGAAATDGEDESSFRFDLVCEW